MSKNKQIETQKTIVSINDATFSAKPRDNTRQRNNITRALNSLMLLQTDAPTKYWNISYDTSRCLEHESKFTLYLTEELYNLSPAWGRVMIWKESSQLEIIKQVGKENNQQKSASPLSFISSYCLLLLSFLIGQT